MRSGVRSAIRERGAEAAMLAVFALWSLVPLGIIFLERDRGAFNGSDGLQVADHLQYLAWVRDAGENVLFANRFDVVADPHLFLHPTSAISGLAWALGASVQAANLIWKPVAVLIVFCGFAAYLRRRLGHDRAAFAGGLALALFFVTPVAPMFDWLGIGDETLEFGNLLMALEMFPGGYVWGGYAGAISAGLVPVFLVCFEALLEPARRRPGRSATWYSIGAGLAGLLATWLHPWQGLTLLLILAGLLAWERLDRRVLRASLGPAALTAAPLAYYFVLSHTDSSWARVSQPNDFPHFGWWLLLGLAPFALAAPGLRSPRGDVGEKMLLLWVPAALVLYLGLGQSWFYHAFIGLSLPLAIFALRGARRMRVPTPAVAVVIAFLTIPGMIFAVQQFTDGIDDHFFRAGEREALAYLDRVDRPGPVLSPLELGQAVPGYTGRNTYVGHYTWTPDHDARVDRARALFAGELSLEEARSLVRESRAAFLLADCEATADLRAVLGSSVASVRRFGCATVYELRALQAQMTPVAPSSRQLRTSKPTASRSRRAAPGASGASL